MIDIDARLYRPGPRDGQLSKPSTPQDVLRRMDEAIPLVSSRQIEDNMQVAHAFNQGAKLVRSSDIKDHPEIVQGFLRLADHIGEDGDQRQEQKQGLGRHHLVVKETFGPRIHAGQLNREELEQVVDYKRLAIAEKSTK